MLEAFKKNRLVAAVWKKIRLHRILKQHARVAEICDAQIKIYLDGNAECYSYVPKKDLGTEKIIWQYWESHGREMPELVKICVESVERNAGDYLLVRLDDANLKDYIDLPQFVVDGKIDKTHFTDVVRLALLSAYGGVWLDATVYLSAPITDDYCTGPFMVYQRSPEAEHKDYWESTWAYYFGWHKDFRVTVLSSIIFAHKGDPSIVRLCDLLLNYWKDHDALPDYFYLQILFHQMQEKGLIEQIPVADDCIPHLLQQKVNDNYPYLGTEDIFRKTCIHKLTYKIAGAADNLKKLIDEYEIRIPDHCA